MSGYKTFLPPVNIASTVGVSIGVSSLIPTPQGMSADGAGRGAASDHFINVPSKQPPVDRTYRGQRRRNGKSRGPRTYSRPLPKMNDSAISIHGAQECLKQGLYAWFGLDSSEGCEPKVSWNARHRAFLNLASVWKQQFGKAVYAKHKDSDGLSFAVGYRGNGDRRRAMAWLKISPPKKKQGGRMHNTVVVEIVARMPWLGALATLQFAYGKQGEHPHDGYGLKHNLFSRVNDGSMPNGRAWADFIADNILPMVLMIDDFKVVERKSGSVGYVLHGLPRHCLCERPITTVLDARRERGPFSTPLFSWVTGYYDY